MRLFDGAFRQIDAVQFARERLAFEPDERQAAVLDGTIARGLAELYTAVGQVHCDGGGRFIAHTTSQGV